MKSLASSSKAALEIPGVALIFVVGSRGAHPLDAMVAWDRDVLTSVTHPDGRTPQHPVHDLRGHADWLGHRLESCARLKGTLRRERPAANLNAPAPLAQELPRAASTVPCFATMGRPFGLREMVDRRQRHHPPGGHGDNVARAARPMA